LTIEDRVTLADAKAALERGRAVVLVCPPAPERVQDVWELLGPGQVLIVCSDDAAAAEWARVAPAGRRVHAVTGLARTAALLKAGSVQTLAGAPKDLAGLAQRSALKLENVSTILVAWPEGLIAGEHAGTLDTLLGEAREARRIVLSWNPTLPGDFLERHARRALMLGTPPIDDAGGPLPPVCRARYAVVPSVHTAARDALDTLKAAAPFVWNGGPVTAPATRPDAVLCTALPTRDELAALARLGEPVLLIHAAQLPYLRSIATLAAFSLPSGADRARDRAEALRERVARRLSDGDVDAELALLDPLFERFDPAEVAGALLALQRETGNETRDAGCEMRDTVVPESSGVTRVKVFVNVGKKDRVTARDLVGALVREVGLTKGDIGRIEVRESFSLIEMTSATAEQAVRGLSAGVTIRGRRVVARLDR
jgi:DbpA-like RNA binding protein